MAVGWMVLPMQPDTDVMLMVGAVICTRFVMVVVVLAQPEALVPVNVTV